MLNPCVRFISALVLSTLLLQPSAFAEPLYGVNGWKRPQFRFGELGFTRDPSCSEKIWAQIENEVVPLIPKVAQYLAGNPSRSPIKIRCEIPILDWVLFTRKTNESTNSFDFQTRTLTVRRMNLVCGVKMCGPAQKLIEELEKRELQ